MDRDEMTRELAELVLAMKPDGTRTRRYARWAKDSSWARRMISPALYPAESWERMQELAKLLSAPASSPASEATPPAGGMTADAPGTIRRRRR